MLGPSAGTLRCVQDRKGRATGPDLVFTMVSGVSLHRGSPLRTLMLMMARRFGDSPSRQRDAVSLDRIRRLQLVRDRWRLPRRAVHYRGAAGGEGVPRRVPA